MGALKITQIDQLQSSVLEKKLTQEAVRPNQVFTG